MNAKEKIEELLEASEDGTITAAQVTEAGLHRSVLQEFVKSGEMYRFGSRKNAKDFGACSSKLELVRRILELELSYIGNECYSPVAA